MPVQIVCLCYYIQLTTLCNTCLIAILRAQNNKKNNTLQYQRSIVCKELIKALST